MANIKYAGKIDGTSLPRIQKFRLSVNTDISEGTPIAINKDKCVTTVFDSNTSGMYGVTARDYKATPDEFNPENGKNYVAVNVSPDSVYELPLTKTVKAASSASDGTAALTGTEFNNVAECFSGISLLLIKHGANPSANAIKVGDELLVSSYEVNTGVLELYFNTTPVITAGDEFLIIPQPGFDNLTVKSGNVTIGTATTDKSYFTVVDSDKDKKVTYIKPKNYLA